MLPSRSLQGEAAQEQVRRLHGLWESRLLRWAQMLLKAQGRCTNRIKLVVRARGRPRKRKPKNGPFSTVVKH